jgi:uncharacterized protein YndB with AHSA1/START domain
VRVRNLFPRTVVLAAAIAVAESGAFAKVASVSPSGFDVRHEAEVAASPARVYRALTEEVGLWWHPDHTHSKNSRNLSIAARPGGCFCEKLPNGGGAEHMRVVVASPGELLRLQGALGPLQKAGLTGHLTWTLTDTGTRSTSSTTVVLAYSVGGHMAAGLDQIAPAVDAVMGEQLQRLEAFVETGRPAGK